VPLVDQRRGRDRVGADACLPAPAGQPTPASVRLTTTASHAWSGPRSQTHQAYAPVPAGTWSGVSSPLRVGCHWAATSGNRVAREFVTDTCRPAHAGQPVKPFASEFASDAGPAYHRWSSATGHRHQHRCDDRCPTTDGEAGRFASTSHSASWSGWSATTELGTPISARRGCAAGQ
jgi:hypothetical protein